MITKPSFSLTSLYTTTIYLSVWISSLQGVPSCLHICHPGPLRSPGPLVVSCHLRMTLSQMYPPLIRQPDGHSILGSHHLHHLLLETVTYSISPADASSRMNIIRLLNISPFASTGENVMECLFALSFILDAGGRGPVQPPSSRNSHSRALPSDAGATRLGPAYMRLAAPVRPRGPACSGGQEAIGTGLG